MPGFKGDSKGDKSTWEDGEHVNGPAARLSKGLTDAGQVTHQWSLHAAGLMGFGT